FVGADSVDQPIEVLTDARLGARAVARFEQDVDGSVELLFGPFDVAQLELFLAGFEAAVRFGDERQDGIIGRLRGSGRRWRTYASCRNWGLAASDGLRTKARSAGGCIQAGDR